jgi:hypothetical protein
MVTFKVMESKIFKICVTVVTANHISQFAIGAKHRQTIAHSRILLCQLKSMESQGLAHGPALIDLVLVVIKHYHVPYGATTCLDKTLCVRDHGVPAGIDTIKMVCISESIYTEFYFYRGTTQSRPDIWSGAGVGADPDRYRGVLSKKILHDLGSISSRDEVSIVPTDQHCVQLLDQIWRKYLLDLI